MSKSDWQKKLDQIKSDNKVKNDLKKRRGHRLINPDIIGDDVEHKVIDKEAVNKEQKGKKDTSGLSGDKT